MHEPLVPMLFPSLGAHVSGAEFQYPDNTWKEVCGLMANIVADSGGNKGQLSQIVEAICRDFRRHDKGVTDKLVEWQRQSNTTICRQAVRTSRTIISPSSQPATNAKKPCLIDE